jgi:hypothetical protein
MRIKLFEWKQHGEQTRRNNLYRNIHLATTRAISNPYSPSSWPHAQIMTNPMKFFGSLPNDRVPQSPDMATA